METPRLTVKEARALAKFTIEAKALLDSVGRGYSRALEKARGMPFFVNGVTIPNEMVTDECGEEYQMPGRARFTWEHRRAFAAARKVLGLPEPEAKHEQS